jgi:hypothetical protein
MAPRALLEPPPPEAPEEDRPRAYDDTGAPIDERVEHELWDWTGTGARWPGGRLETTVVLPNPDVGWRRRMRSAGRL